MGVLAWIIFGLIAGAIAKMIKSGDQNIGWLMTSVLGIIGASVGGFIGKLLGLGGTDTFGFDLGSMALAVIGSLILLWIYGKATKR